MNKSVKKFYDFLEDYTFEKYEPQVSKIIMNNQDATIFDVPSCIIKESKRISIHTEKMDIEDKKAALKIKKETDEIGFLRNVLSGGIVDTFNEFDILSKYLIISKMNSKECLDIITHIIVGSINDIETKNIDLDIIEIVSFSKYNLLPLEKQRMISDCISYINVPYEVLTEEEKQKKKTAIKYEKMICIENPKEFFDKLYEFKKSYIDKIDSFNLNDVLNVISILDYLKIDKEIVGKIKIYLEKEVEKRNKKEEVIAIPKRKEFKSNLLTDKEYKTLKKELYSYYDLYHMQKTKELTEDEKLRVIYLLLKIGEPLVEVGNFLRLFELDYKDYVKSNISLINSNNSISLYLELYEKLKFYSERLNIKANLKYIEECFKELFICGDEDYVFYKNEIENELLRILNVLPQDYDYEISQIDKRIKLELN